MTPSSSAWPVIIASFLASFVEVVETFTIVLAVGAFQGWRPALAGLFAGLAFVAALVIALGPLILLIPLHALRLTVGVLSLLFGLRWLRKAVLRATGVIPLRNEAAAYAKETAQLQDAARREKTQADWAAGVTAFKAVVLEGVEVAFVVVAVGAGRDMLWPASLGALAAVAIVLAIGLVVHKPLARVPENTLKFGVGVMLSAFGLFWAGEGLGIAWPGDDGAILFFAAAFASTGLALVPWARRPRLQADQ